MKHNCAPGYAVLFAASIWVMGCGGKPAGPEVIPVSGTVTLDGKPLADARVTFYPQVPKVNPSIGMTNAEGKYQLSHGAARGAVPGSYKVIVEHYVMPDGKPFKQDQEGMDIEQMKMQGKVAPGVPAQYSDVNQSPLKGEVTKGKTNVIDLALVAK